jgi:hypothetical protein
VKEELDRGVRQPQWNGSAECVSAGFGRGAFTF